MTVPIYGVSRRTLLRVAMASGAARFFSPRLSAADPPPPAHDLPIDRLVLDKAPTSRHASHKRYRAHAYVHVLAIPVFSRLDVGAGYAVVEQALSDPQSLECLQFAGGSAPDRAHGLNRVGFIQEAVLQQEGRVTRSAYYGFMVSSGEKNLEQARKSLQTDTSASIPYVTASGEGLAGRFHCTSSHLGVPARFTWRNFDQLSREMRAKASAGYDTQHYDVSLDSAAASPNTFLHSMRRAILSDQKQWNGPIVYNGKRYTLATDKQADPRAGQQMIERGVTHHKSEIWRLNGTLNEKGTRQSTSFQVWYEKGDATGLPARIEFYPKSFLKLVFEQDEGAQGPPVIYHLTRNGEPAEHLQSRK